MFDWDCNKRNKREVKIMKKKDWFVMILGICFIIICFLFPLCLVHSCSKKQVTPGAYLKATWVSEKPDIYFGVSEAGVSEGVLTMDNGETIRIYVNWTPGSQCMTIFDADKEDSGKYYTNDTILIEGYGNWLGEKYIVNIDTDNIGINVSTITFSKEE